VPTATLEPTETATESPTATSRSSATPTSTPLTGPIVTAFGIADASGTFNVRINPDEDGPATFVKQAGDGFIIFVEGRPGLSRSRVGTNLLNFRPGDPASQPDLQIESTRPLGDGSKLVCDNSLPTLGGVPAVNPPDFSAVEAVSDPLNDLSCRFKTFLESGFACTQDSSGNLIFGNQASTVQFCTLIDDALTLPGGDTLFTVRLRDIAGHAGPPMQIIVRTVEGN